MIPQTVPDDAQVRVKRACERRPTFRAIIQQAALQRIRAKQLFMLKSRCFHASSGLFTFIFVA
jgi:hypothetical protein